MTSYFVRATGGSDSNDGLSHANAWATIQHAIDTMTTGQANRLNVSGSFTLAATLDFASRPYSPTTDFYLLIAGYTAAEDDGGVAQIDCGGGAFVSDTNLDSMHVQGITFTNWGSDYCISVDNDCSACDCEFDGGGTASQVMDADNSPFFVRNKVHSLALSNLGAVSFPLGNATVMWNYFHVASSTTNEAVVRIASSSIAMGNVINITGWNSGCIGIFAGGDNSKVIGNTVVNQDAVNGSGIAIDNAAIEDVMVINNVIEGFAIGVESVAGTVLGFYGGNRFYGCASDESLSGELRSDLGGNATLGASPFASLGNPDPNDDDFSISADLDASGYPDQMYNADLAFGSRNVTNPAAGALQRPAGGGGSTLIVVDD